MTLTEKGRQAAARVEARKQGKEVPAYTPSESQVKQQISAWEAASSLAETRAQQESIWAGLDKRAGGASAKESLAYVKKQYVVSPYLLPGEHFRHVRDIAGGVPIPWKTETDIPASTSIGNGGGIVETIINIISGGAEGGWGSPVSNGGGAGSAEENGMLSQKNLLIGGAAIAGIVGLAALSRGKSK